MRGKVLMGHKTHGVAQVQLADMYLAAGVQHAVHPEGTFIAGCDDGLEPTLDVVLESGGEAHSLRYLSVGQQQVGTVDAVLGAEKGVAYEEQTALGYAVFEGEIGHHLPPGFGQDALLLRQHSVYPIPVQRGEAAADPLMIPLLISFGLTEFSVSAPSVLKVRKNIAKWTKAEADAVAEKVMSFTTEKEITDYLNTVI